MSPTLTAILAAAGIAGLLAILYLYVLPARATNSAAKSATPFETPAVARPGSHPLAKHLELTGVRVRETKGGRVNIQMLVVNHSAAELPPLTLDVSLRSADRTFFEFPAKVPGLGPFEVKDLETSLRTNLKPYELPDWQMIRPEFRIQAAP